MIYPRGDSHPTMMRHAQIERENPHAVVHGYGTAFIRAQSRSGRSCSGTPVAPRDNCWPRPSRDIRRSVLRGESGCRRVTCALIWPVAVAAVNVAGVSDGPPGHVLDGGPGRKLFESSPGVRPPRRVLACLRFMGPLAVSGSTS